MPWLAYIEINFLYPLTIAVSIKLTAINVAEEGCDCELLAMQISKGTLIKG